MRPFGFLFAPGAGAPSSHPWMQHWGGLLQTIAPVECCDYPYMLERRRYPDPLPKLIAAHRAALEKARLLHGPDIVLIGKSMGGRIGCHLALEEQVPAVICLGYPLCAGGDAARMRDEVLLAAKVPLLFVQGTRDSLCPLDLLEQVRVKMLAPNGLHIVEGGDHSLQVSKTQLKSDGKTQADIDQEILAAIRQFVEARRPA